MPRSLARGDYSLVMAIESGSRPNSWYRVLADRRSGVLSCDCPSWTFNRNEDAEGRRICLHTDFATMLATRTPARDGTVQVSTTSPLLSATQTQWPGLRGDWQLQQADSRMNNHPYRVVLLRLALGNGGVATGTVAFASRHHHSEREMIAGVAGWAGYAIAAEVAHLAGMPLIGQPPEHFRIDRRPSTGTRQRRVMPAQVPSIGLADILRVGDIVDQGDGLTPMQRAANTLRLFLGEETYAQVERQGFLDISSARHQGRVYRLRRDPERERRIRVMEQGVYQRDLCVVSAMTVPPDDTFLTVFLGLLSDEEATLSVVRSHNIFSPYSDGTERETIPAVWTPRPATTPVA